MGNQWSTQREIELFQEYLRIDTSHPDPNYMPCVRFLRRLAASLRLPINVYYPGGPTKPVVLFRWTGTDPTLPSILLNSHMDVVPAIAENWTYPPFDARIDAEGRVYARGSQDMKSVGLQYLAGIRKLRSENIRLKRTVYVLFVPDEEIGGALGMAAFVKTSTFADLNVGIAFDEGAPSSGDHFIITYGERTLWQILFRCHGPTGHGSTLFRNTAGEKLNRLTTKIMEFRQAQLDMLDSNPGMQAGLVSSVNLTVLRGGDQVNVVPSTVVGTFDIRLALDVDLKEFENQIYGWCKEAGDGIDVVFIQKRSAIEPSSIEDSNKYWAAFRDALTVDLNLKIEPMVSTGSTDVRNIRALGIPGYGFSPIDNTPSLLHANDEYLRISTYLKGIDIYRAILLRVGNIGH